MPKRMRFGLFGAATLAIVALASIALAPRSKMVSAAASRAASVATVQTIQPALADMSHGFNTNGTMEAYETADLYPKVSGYLSEVRVDIGDRVKAGQILAIISLPETEKELAEAEATVAAKRADLALQRITLQRQEGLLKIQGTSRQTYDEARGRTAVAEAEVELAVATAEKIRTILSYSRVVAPFDGVVSHRQVNRGDFVQAATAGRTTALFTVQRVDIIRIFCNVPESDVSSLRIGLPASIKPYGWETPIAGEVTRFEGRLDPQTRNMRTEIDVPNADGRLYPGMYAQVALETAIRKNALTLPAAAIGTDASGRFVYVVRDDRIVRLSVQIGMTEAGLVEITGGLSERDQVVASVQGAPVPGSKVKLAPHM